MSYQICRLEKILGTRLLRRHAGAVEPTVSGRAMAESISHAFAQFEIATSQMRTIGQPENLVISVNPTLAKRFLMPRLHEFKKLYPEQGIEINCLIDQVPIELSAFDVHLSFCQPITENVDIYSSRLFDNSYYAPVINPCLFAEKGGVADFELFRRVPLLADWTMKEIVDIGWSDWFDAAGMKHPHSEAAVEFGHSDFALEAVAAGAGVCLAELHPGSGLLEGTLISPFDTVLRSKLVTAFHCVASKLEEEKVQNFLGWIRDVSVECQDETGRLIAGKRLVDVGPCGGYADLR